MPGLPELSRDLAREYRITQADAREIIQFINQDIVSRLANGEDLHIDRFGSFKMEDGSVRFNQSKFMKDFIVQQQNSVNVTGED